MPRQKNKKVASFKAEKMYREIEKSDVFACLAPLLKAQKHTITDYSPPKKLDVRDK